MRVLPWLTLAALAAACSSSTVPAAGTTGPDGQGQGAGGGNAGGQGGGPDAGAGAESGGSQGDPGCLSCVPPAEGGSAAHVTASLFETVRGCFAPATSPLCAVCLGDGPSPDAGLAPGGHCIVSPNLDAYYLVTQPLSWNVAPGWFVSDTLVGFPSGGVGTATAEQAALCGKMEAQLPKMPAPDAGPIFPPFEPPPCK